jgi:hypothetical protein
VLPLLLASLPRATAGLPPSRCRGIPPAPPLAGEVDKEGRGAGEASDGDAGEAAEEESHGEASAGYVAALLVAGVQLIPRLRAAWTAYFIEVVLFLMWGGIGLATYYY